MDGPRLFDLDPDDAAASSRVPEWHPSVGSTADYQRRLREAAEKVRQSPGQRRHELARKAAGRSKARRDHHDADVRAGQRARRQVISLATAG